VAAALGVDRERVTEAMALEDLCHPRSLDGPGDGSDEEGSVPLREMVGGEDPALARVEDRIAWEQVLRGLDPQLRRVISLRYYRSFTQQETARRLGVSQMQISRLERRALDQLRHEAVRS
jgi:RNA polymerase sigma-B factor